MAQFDSGFSLTQQHTKCHNEKIDVLQSSLHTIHILITTIHKGLSECLGEIVHLIIVH